MNVSASAPQFSGLRLYLTKDGISADHPVQLTFNDPNNDPKLDQVTLMHNWASNDLDLQNDACRRLLEEVRDFFSNSSRVLLEDLRPRLAQIIRQIKPSPVNQPKVEEGQSTAWDVLSTHKKKLLELLKSPDYVFQYTKDYGLLFMPKNRTKW